VIDAMNDDQQLILIYFADDAVGPASGGAHPFEFAQQWPTRCGWSIIAPSMNSTIAAAVPSVNRRS
jgi:hypothetical protein